MPPKTKKPMVGPEELKRQKAVIADLETVAREVYDKIASAQVPAIGLPTRTKGNIVFSEKDQVWKYGTLETLRTAKTLEGAYMLARTMYSVDFIKQMIGEAKSSTLREMYYISEGWGLAKFHAQDESDKLIEDLEIKTKQMREALRLRPEENGASIIGNITIEEVNRKGEKKKFNCRDDVGDGGYGIPYNVEKEKIKFIDWDAKFVIAIECLDADEPLVVQNGHHTKTPTIGSFVDAHLAGPGMKKLGDVEYSSPKWPVQVLALSPGGTLGWRRVTRVMRQPIKNRMLHIRTTRNREINATASHKMVVYDNSGFGIKRAGELCPGDLVPVATRLPGGERVDDIEAEGTKTDVVLEPVKEITSVNPSTDFVYDITVEGDHTFTAGRGNIITHNCGGMFDRLAENGFDEKEDAVLVHLKGQPARCTRRLIRRLNDECKLPVVVFTDGDPWSFRIFASVAYGAIKTAHISEYLATPEAQFCGVTPSDIENYKLPSDKLNDQDIKALKAELTDPRFKGQVIARKADGREIMWEDEIKLQLEMGKKSEQQALAKYGLNFVTENYLPEKLSEIGIL